MTVRKPDSKKPPHKSTLRERFWKYANMQADNECWEWTGARHPRGYGMLNEKGKPVKAHRLAYEIGHGLIPEGMMICHTCNNPPCVNWHHLYAGVQKDNWGDAVKAGTTTIGKREHTGTKLTAEDVAAIRASTERPMHLAAKYGVSRPTISDIKHNRTWRNG